MKILFCILSDQHIPNLLSVHLNRPDYLILLESSYMEKKSKAQHFIKALNKSGQMNFAEGRNCEVVPIDQVDRIERVKTVLTSVYRRHPADRWIVNISGGTKIMAIAAHDFFRNLAERIEYVNEQKPNVILQVGSDQQKTSSYRVSVEEFLTGYGFEIRTEKRDIDLRAEHGYRWFSCAKKIAKHTRGKGILHISGGERERGREEGLPVTESSFSRKLTMSVKDKIHRTFFRNHAPFLTGWLNPHAVSFLTGGWLELFVMQILKKHREQLGIWDIMSGILIESLDTGTENELDVVFLKDDYRLCIVECKSGGQKYDRDFDVLYKLEAVANQMRALRLSPILCTTAPRVFKSDGGIREALKNRSDLYRIKLLTYKDINRLAKTPDDVGLVRRTFFS